MPQAQELWAVFLCGGLIGVVLYRLWTMLATSLVGALVFWHCVFLLLEQLGAVDAAAFAEKHAAWLNGGVVVVTITGIGVQAWTAKLQGGVKDEKEKGEAKGKPALAAA
jgi:hypothetical protein